MNVPAQAERTSSPFLCLFVLFEASVDWMMLTHKVRVIFITQSTKMLISSRNTFVDTPPNKVLSALWASFSPIKLTHEINHHNWFLLKKIRIFGNTGLVLTYGKWLVGAEWWLLPLAGLCLSSSSLSTTPYCLMPHPLSLLMLGPAAFEFAVPALWSIMSREKRRLNQSLLES